MWCSLHVEIHGGTVLDNVNLGAITETVSHLLRWFHGTRASVRQCDLLVLVPLVDCLRW